MQQHNHKKSPCFAKKRGIKKKKKSIMDIALAPAYTYSVPVVPFLVLFQKYTLYQQTRRGQPLVLVARGWTFSSGDRSANTSSSNRRNRVDTSPKAHVDSSVLQPAVLYYYYYYLFFIIYIVFPHISPISRTRGHRRRLPFPYRRYIQKNK